MDADDEELDAAAAVAEETEADIVDATDIDAAEGVLDAAANAACPVTRAG